MDLAALRWLAPLRSTLVATAVIVACLQFTDPATAVTVGIGAVLVSLADLRGGFADRMRGMVLTAGLVTASAGIGLLVSDFFPVHLIVAGLVAAFCGYIGLAGPRAAFAGVLGLVCFTLFSGTPEPLQAVVPAMLMVLIGGSLQILFAALPELFRRLGGLRTDISVAYRTVALALRGKQGGIETPNAIAKLLAARRLVETSGATGDTERWCRSLIDACDQVRIAFLGLDGCRELDRDFDEDAFDRLAGAVADLLMAVSATLELRLRAGKMGDRRARFESELKSCRTAFGDDGRAFLDDIEAGCETAVAEASGQWPIGRRADVHPRVLPDADWVGRLWHRQDPGQLFTRHAIRLGLLIMVATAIAEVANVNHAYWLPLTVAWVTRPDLAGTAEKVVSRIGGTLLGLIAFGAVVLLFGSSQPVMLAVFAVGMFLAISWFPANYSVCIIAVTAFLLALLSLDFPDVTELIEPRMVETVAGGLLVLFVAWAWPTKLTDQLAQKLSAMAKAVARFAGAVRDGTGTELAERRNEVMLSRFEAANLVNAAEHEPGTYRPRYEQAREVLDNLTGAALVALAAHEAAEAGGQSPSAQITPESMEGLDDLVGLLDSPSADSPGTYEATAPTTEFEQRVAAALAALEGPVDRTPGSPARA